VVSLGVLLVGVLAMIGLVVVMIRVRYRLRILVFPRRGRGKDREPFDATGGDGHHDAPDYPDGD
jgi:hypothetical protein